MKKLIVTVLLCTSVGATNCADDGQKKPQLSRSASAGSQPSSSASQNAGATQAPAQPQYAYMAREDISVYYNSSAQESNKAASSPSAENHRQQKEFFDKAHQNN